MKFMITWQVHEGKLLDATKIFSQMTAKDDKKDRGENINLIGRWHSIGDGTGVTICETEDPQALGAWALNWMSFLDVQVKPILDDEEVREIGRKKFSEQSVELETFQ